MTLVITLPNGKKIVKSSGTADNSGGSAAADIDVTITFGELQKVETILSGYGDVAVTEKSVSGNTVTVTAKSVPAGATATVYVVALGF